MISKTVKYLRECASGCRYELEYKGNTKNKKNEQENQSEDANNNSRIIVCVPFRNWRADYAFGMYMLEDVKVMATRGCHLFHSPCCPASPARLLVLAPTAR